MAPSDGQQAAAPRPARRGSTAAGCLLAIVSTYLTLVAITAVLPFVAPPRLLYPGGPTGVPDELNVPDQVLGYAYRPSYRGHFLGDDRAPLPLVTNALGYRDDEFEPLTDRPRILVVGDSITFGAGVPAEQLYAARLETYLPGWRVDNCGIAGYESNQIVAVAARMIPRLKPRVLLYGMCLNDIREADVPGILAGFQAARQTQLKPILELRSLVRFAGSVAGLQQAKQRSRTGMRRAEAGTMRRWTEAGERDRLKRYLTELKQVADQAGVPLYVVVFPYTFQFDRPAADPLRQPQRELQVMLQRLGVPMLDLFDAFERPAEPLFILNDNCHPNPAGHDLAARCMAVWLQDLGVVQQTTASRPEGLQPARP